MERGKCMERDEEGRIPVVELSIRGIIEERGSQCYRENTKQAGLQL